MSHTSYSIARIVPKS